MADIPRLDVIKVGLLLLVFLLCLSTYFIPGRGPGLSFGNGNDQSTAFVGVKVDDMCLNFKNALESCENSASKKENSCADEKSAYRSCAVRVKEYNKRVKEECADEIASVQSCRRNGQQDCRPIVAELSVCMNHLATDMKFGP